MKNLHLLPTDKPSRLAGSEYVINVQGIDKRAFKLKLWNKFIPNEELKDVGYIPQHIYITSDEEIKEGDWVIHCASNKLFKYDGRGLCVEAEKIILTTDQHLIVDGVQAIDDEFLEWFVKNPSCESVDLDTFLMGDRVLYNVVFPQEEPNKTHYLDELPNMDKNVLAKMWADAMPKYPIGGYAPGLYSCVCVSCKKEFMGDKRAVQCEPCAIEMVNTEIVENNGGYQIKKSKQETLEEVKESYLDSPLPHSYKGAVEFGAKWQQERMYSEEEVLELLQKALTHKDNGETGNLITTQGEIRTANFYSWFEQFKKK